MAGLSGEGIRLLGLNTCRHLVDLREKRGFKDVVIVGVGGVMTPEDFDAYIAVGVDLVQSCTGLFANPELGVEIRTRTVTTQTTSKSLARNRVKEALAQGKYGTASSIAKAIDLPPEAVEDILREPSGDFRTTLVPDASGSLLYTLKSHPISLRERLALWRMLAAKSFR
jgi:tRNA-dihydrouridine synthase